MEELVTPPRPGETVVKVETDFNIIPLDKLNTEVEVFCKYNGQTMCHATIRFKGDPKILATLCQNVALVQKKLTSNLITPAISNGSGH